MIQVRNLTKHFGPNLAVDNLSFEVEPGRVTGFLGPNGAGKTTTLRMILGLVGPEKGTATIDGISYQGLRAPMREVGAVLDAKAYQPGRKARDHLLALAQASRIPVKRVDEVLGFVGLSDVADRRAGAFSLGMAQRLGIAGAMLGDPPVLIFDEPVNGLDPEGIVWIRTLMQGLAAQGRTVFVSSHLMSEMAITASHVIVIGRGHLIIDSDVEELIKRSSGTLVRLRTPKAEVVVPRLQAAGGNVETDGDGAIVVTGLEAAAIGDIAFQAGAPVHELSPVEASLEEVFMELTRDDVEFHGGGVGAIQ
ncbi:MAG TPA: ATP-binding cassette domain-containing protein [Acidimicrobiales bacterium]|nr:ATP-binding cassette domain-containing protein [Acidimicrobiales bacterium]